MNVARIACLLALSAVASSATAVPIVSAPPERAQRSAPAAQLPPESPAGREHRAGIAALLKGDRDGAKARFDAALRLDARHVPSVIGLAAVAQAQGRNAEVERLLARAESLAPRSPEVLLARARYLLGRGDAAGAEAAMKSAVQLAPESLPPLLELGAFYLRTADRKAEALPLYRKAVSLQPNSAVAQSGLGMAEAVSGNRDEALAAFARAAALSPRDPLPLQATGRLHLEAGAADKALASFDTGLARAPKHVSTMLDRSDALARLGRLPEATRQLLAADALAPGSPEIQVKLGDVQQASGAWKDAEASYLKAIELAPNHPIAYNNLAWMTVARQGDGKKAVAWARKAVALSPGSSAFLDTLGWAERAAGDLPAAEASLKRAIALEPKVAAYHYRLGVVYRDGGQPAEARAAIERALALDARMPEAGEARRLLASLPPR